MKSAHLGALAVFALMAFVWIGSSRALQTQRSPAHAAGSFDVTVTPDTTDQKVSSTPGRMSVRKRFHGDLDGTSTGEMLTAGTSVKGSAAYVAIEQVSGTLKGRTGTFVLQHNGVMDRGRPHLNIAVVPDSGTGQLVGLTGRMTIRITGGKYFYDFYYSLPQLR